MSYFESLITISVVGRLRLYLLVFVRACRRRLEAWTLNRS